MKVESNCEALVVVNKWTIFLCDFELLIESWILKNVKKKLTFRFKFIHSKLKYISNVWILIVVDEYLGEGFKSQLWKIHSNDVNSWNFFEQSQK